MGAVPPGQVPLSGFLPIGNVQPFADGYGYGNKTRKPFHLRDVVRNLLRVIISLCF